MNSGLPALEPGDPRSPRGLSVKQIECALISSYERTPRARARSHSLRADAAQRGEMLDHLPSLIRGFILKHSVPLTFQCRDLGE